MNDIIGVDVSEFNEDLNWKLIKATGISFAVIRCGYGKNTVDEKFLDNVKGCIENNIPFGVYHFSYALNEDEAINEAKFVISLIAPYKHKITLPVFFDFEYDTISYAKKQGVILGRNAFNSHTLAFTRTIKSAGYCAGVYYNLDFLNRYVDPHMLAGLPVWYAQYDNCPDFKNYDIWQYSSTFKIAGHNCYFDVNILKNARLLERKEKEKEKEVNEKRYNTVSELPSWGKDTIIKLINKGVISGNSDKKDIAGRPADLNLSVDMIRLLVINDRAGLYDE